jgi:CheY-like chemotaxis protein
MTSPAHSTPHVLVVDDDPDMLRVIQAVLEDEGLVVTTAADGGRAVAIAQQQTPDLAVLDMTLPVLDGSQVAARLRDLLGGEFPVLAITADGHAAEKARRLAAYTYLSKPFELGDLVSEVWRGLDRKKSKY